MRLWPSRRTQPPAEQRDQFAALASVVPTWMEVSGAPGYAYTPVTRDTAVGLPAAYRAVSLVCDLIADLPCQVFQGTGANKRLIDGSWQHLLNELPGLGDFTTFDFFSDVSACLELSGNAFVQKVKAAGEVVALIVIDPARVQVKRERGEKVFLVRGDQGDQVTLTSSTILHIRGFTTNGSDVGLSPIALHRQRLGLIAASEQYAARMYGQGVGKKVAIQVPGPLKPDDAKTMLDTFKANHTGVENSHLPALLMNGATIGELGFSPEDAQYVETEQMNLIQAAHIFKIPPKFLLGEDRHPLAEWDFIALAQLSLSPRLRRIAKALHTDPDLFPDRSLYPEFDLRELYRTDAKTKSEVEHQQIQDGSLLIDEARAERGEGPLPPIPDNPEQTPGMVPQLTPVGGAPNPPPPAA
jgi:HK97 family phage portal protein